MGGKGVRREGEGVREEGKGRSEGRQYTRTLVSITESNTVLYLQKVAEHWQFILEECDGQWIALGQFIACEGVGKGILVAKLLLFMSVCSVTGFTIQLVCV